MPFAFRVASGYFQIDKYEPPSDTPLFLAQNGPNFAFYGLDGAKPA